MVYYDCVAPSGGRSVNNPESGESKCIKEDRLHGSADSLCHSFDARQSVPEFSKFIEWRSLLLTLTFSDFADCLLLRIFLYFEDILGHWAAHLQCPHFSGDLFQHRSTPTPHTAGMAAFAGLYHWRMAWLNKLAHWEQKDPPNCAGQICTIMKKSKVSKHPSLSYCDMTSHFKRNVAWKEFVKCCAHFHFERQCLVNRLEDRYHKKTTADTPLARC
ncbi:unnamed protein product [Protopolystoma xenopodis]|uniref:Uncharacterized protein n=1 Tax=Protopolystoma xenopodis TaxID=117903 RepID=A0A3S5A4V5_9PLAT|nr:unnamed protein product [Protopolystoma xenopodis]